MKILNNSEKVNYHIYCFEYLCLSNILLSFNYDEKYKNIIFHLSLYNNLTNSDKNINLDNKDYKINIKTYYFCIKIAYKINNQIEKLISFYIEKSNEYNENSMKKMKI